MEELEILKNNHSKEYFYKIRNLDRDFDFYSLSEFSELQDLFILIKPALTDSADIMQKEILIPQWKFIKILKSTIKI